MMSPEKYDIGLLDDIYKLLVEYYNTAYDHLNFYSIAEASQNPERSDCGIVV